MFCVSRKLRIMTSLRAGFLMFFVGVACAAGHLGVEERLSQPATFRVLSMDHQSTGGQSYPRGRNFNKQVSTYLVQGSYAVACGLKIDTSSGVLSATLHAATAYTAATKPVAPNVGKYNNTPDISASQKPHTIRAAVTGAIVRGCQGCAALPAAFASGLVSLNTDAYDLSALPGSVYQIHWKLYTRAQHDAAAAKPALATQFGSKSQGCPHSSEVCGSNVSATSQFNRRAALTPGDLSAAAELLLPTYPASYKIPLEGGDVANGPALFQVHCSCGKHLLQASPAPACIYMQSSGWAMEAACTCNAGGAPSEIGLARQVYKAGLVSKTGSCYKHPQNTTTECGAILVPNSAAEFGPTMPCSVRSLSSLGSAPLAPLSASRHNLPDSSASPSTLSVRLTIWSVVTGASLPGHQGDTATTVSSASSPMSVLCNIAANDQNTMPHKVYQIHWKQYTRAQHDAAAANATLATQYGSKFQGCPHSSEVCGSNVSATSQINHRTPLTPEDLSAAAELLLPTYPASYKIPLEGGDVANGPALFQVHCSCGKHLLQASPAPACIYMQSSGWAMEAACTCNAGGAPSEIGIARQVYKAGLVSKTGSCYKHPQNMTTECGAILVPNSAADFGPAMPCALRSLSSLSSAPLAPLSASWHNLPNSSASPNTITIRSVVTGASLPGHRGDTATTVSSASSPMSVLCNIAANNQNTMPHKVYQAYLEYYTSACATAFNSAMAKYDSKIQGRDANLSWPQSRQIIHLSTSTAKIANAASLWLAGLWLYGRFVQINPGDQAVGRSCIDYTQRVGTLHGALTLWPDAVLYLLYVK